MTVVGVHHVSINVADVGVALDFYVERLGLVASTDRPDFGFAGAWLYAGAQQVHLIEGEVPSDKGQHLALHVGDLDGTISRLRTEGVTVSDAFPVGTGRQAFLHDPSGNLVELHQPAESRPTSRVPARHAGRMTGAIQPRRSWADRLRPLRRLVGPIEAAQVRRFGRSGLSVIFRTPVLVLETVGRRTGATRSTPLAYHRCADGSLVVIGGAGGQVRIPDWVANLRADPAVVAVVDRRRVALQAVELVGSDHDLMWTEISRVSPRIDVYARRAGRRAPMFRLEPAPDNP